MGQGIFRNEMIIESIKDQKDDLLTTFWPRNPPFSSLSVSSKYVLVGQFVLDPLMCFQCF